MPYINAGLLAALAGAHFSTTALVAAPELVLAVLAMVANPFVGAILISIAAVAILAEIKAGASGLGILVSFLAMGLFFVSSVTMGLASWVEILMALLGMLALAAEVFVLPGFGIAGIVGLGLFGAAVMLAMLGPSPTSGDITVAALALLSAAALTAALVYAWVRRLPSNRRFHGLLLSQSMESAAGYVSSVSRGELVGTVGTSLTALRPAGVADFGGERLDVISEGDFLPPGIPVVVVRSEGYRHVVRRAAEALEAPHEPVEVE